MVIARLDTQNFSVASRALRLACITTSEPLIDAFRDMIVLTCLCGNYGDHRHGCLKIAVLALFTPFQHVHRAFHFDRGVGPTSL